MWLVAIGSNLSALWILIANSFMQEPVGYTLNNGRAEMTDFFALLANPHVWVQFPHVLTAAVTTAGFFVLGISAYHLLRPASDREVFRRSFRMAVLYALAGAITVMLLGHSQSQHMAQVQPMKMAAAEALWESANPASFSLLTIGNEPERRDVVAFRIPGALSFLAYNRFTGEVKGIKDLQAEYESKFGPGDYVPPVAISYWSFRLMIGAGILMALLALLGLYLVLRQKFETSRRYLQALMLAMLLPYLANTTGWLFTEIGRQPWIVFGLQKTADGVSPNVSGGAVLLTFVGFAAVYGVLIAVDVYLLRKYARDGSGDGEEASAPAERDLSGTALPI
jgi:cytochrome d ubiquinol oxidase subunit I